MTIRAKYSSRRPPEVLLEAVISALHTASGGVAVDELTQQLRPAVSRRTLQRRLAQWSASGAIRAEGAGKARRYFAAEAGRGLVINPGSGSLAIAGGSATVDEYVPLSVEGQAVRELVGQPIVRRNPVGYRREFLDRYQPNVTSYVTDRIARHLLEIGRTPNGSRPAGTYARDILNRLLIDLSWASSHLEGNTYSLLDTEQLLQNGRVPSGKDAKETQMILNHKAAIELLVESATETGVDRFTLLNLHALLADNLLADPLQAGRLRRVAVGIGGSVYLPTAIPQLIEEQFAKVIEKAAAIHDPFEQSFFLMVHVPLSAALRRREQANVEARSQYPVHPGQSRPALIYRCSNAGVHRRCRGSLRAEPRGVASRCVRVGL
ncbi:MAG: hypothetical protein WDO56_23720 [Gammaproteobacteria bacterium]